MDTIADTLTIIRNGYLARKKQVQIRHSRQNEAIVKKLVDLKFLESVSAQETEGKKYLQISLLYDANKPAVEGLERISKPSVRVYTQVNKTPKVLGGLGEVVLSTPKGILSGKEAKSKKVAGEILFKVW